MTPFRETTLGQQVQGIREANRQHMIKPKPPRTKSLDWSTAELKRAITLRLTGGSWDAIAEDLGTGRAPRGVQVQVNRYLRRLMTEAVSEAELFDEAHVYAELRAATDGYHGVQHWAEEHGFHVSTIHKQRSAEHKLSASVARALGYERCVVYRKKR